MLEKYCKENGFTNYRFYVDDGYSHVNFVRPSFEKSLHPAAGYGILFRVKTA